MNLKDAEDIKKLLDSYKESKPPRISDLLILGLLSYRNLSGYDIYRFIERKADVSGSLLKLQKATVYNTLSRMADQGFVEIVEKKQHKKRPIKSIYTLTDKGRNHLRELLIGNMGAPPILFINYYLDVTLYHVLTKNEITEALQEKINHTKSFIQFSQLYAHTMAGTVLGVIVESEIEMLIILLKTLEELLTLLSEKSTEELFQIGEIKEDELLKKMETASKEVDL